jgi:uncharacterized membrane protein YhhN
MKVIHLFAMHGRFFAGRGLLVLFLVVAAVLLVALWPGKETK